MPDIIRWKPRPGTLRMRSIDTRVDHVDANGEKVYRAWPADRPEPEGNPVKWSESTLRICYEKADDEATG